MCYCYVCWLLLPSYFVGEAVRTIATTMLWRSHSAPINAGPENMLFGGAREQQKMWCLAHAKFQARIQWRAVRRLVSTFD